jgi:molybdopterin converting factor small subunit
MPVALVRIHIKYHNMLRRLTGVDMQALDLPAGCTVQTALEAISRQYGHHLHEMLFSPNGTVATHLVIFHNGQLTRDDPDGLLLSEGDELMLFPSISGG